MRRMPRDGRFGRALALVILAMALQPLFALACMALHEDGYAPPASDTALFAQTDSDDDDALDVVFGGDPVVIAGIFTMPLLEPRACVAAPDPASVPASVPDPADHPPRLG